jgi:hypothetical protein
LPFWRDLEPEAVTTWQVTRAWKGIDAEVVRVRSGTVLAGRCSPGAEFLPGDEGLLYVSRSGHRFYSSLCLPRFGGQRAAEHARWLGPGTTKFHGAGVDDAVPPHVLYGLPAFVLVVTIWSIVQSRKRKAGGFTRLSD